MRDFQISEAVLRAIQVQIGAFPAERGGMLGQDQDGVIRHFIFDFNALCGAAEYSPDTAYLNKIIGLWKDLQITFCGFVHSHPGLRHPSRGDEIYAATILKHFERLDLLWLPIVQTIPNTGKFDIVPFAAIRSRRRGVPCRIKQAELSIVDRLPKRHSRIIADADFEETEAHDLNISVDQERGSAGMTVPEAGTRIVTSTSGHEFESLGNEEGNLNYQTANSLEEGTMAACETKRWERLARAFDLQMHAETQLIVIGAGGGASFILNCARMGIGEFVLVDPDTVSETNIATQSADPSSVGEYKVDALAKQIKLINPKASVHSVAKRIEEIDDVEFEDLLVTGDRSKSILMVLTDNFHAQARGHRLALHFGLPTICAQEYQEGLGAEVTFTVPGLTPACHRCITSSRYQAYLESGFTNNVTSEGAPIFAAEFLNATLGHIVLAVLYSGTSHPRFGSLLNEIRDRNLIRLRMSPSFDDVFGDAFSRRISGACEPDCFRMLDCIFILQTPDKGQSRSRPSCPDCRGTGNLTDAFGTFADTRELRRSVSEDDVPAL